MSRHLDAVIAAAISDGIIPASAARPREEQRPWPVIVLTALGAWLAAIPLLALCFLGLGDALMRGAGPYLVGVVLIAGAVAIVRAAAVSLFVEQLGIVGLLVGGLSLGIGLFNDFSNFQACLVLALLAIGVAALVPRHWMRVLLGAAACVATIAGISGFDRNHNQSWLALQILAGLWLALEWLRSRAGDSDDTNLGSLLEHVGTGWLAVTLVGLAAWSGATFLAGGSLAYAGGRAGMLFEMQGAARIVSTLAALAGVACLAYRWSSLRAVWAAAAALVVLFLASFMATLGTVLLLLAVCAVNGRGRMASAAGVAAAWIIGAFYYQLSLPLATKAVIIVGAGAALGLIAWSAARGALLVAGATERNPLRSGRNLSRASIGIGASLMGVLLVANVGIWQKEMLISRGRPVFVALAPVDPRSLMQGDFMALRFQLPGNGLEEAQPAGAPRPKVVAKIDAKGVAELIRYHDGRPLAQDEMLIELTLRGGQWTFVTDAWYFKEGDAQKWEAARYGEFRVDKDGNALLVGMRNEKLEAL